MLVTLGGGPLIEEAPLLVYYCFPRLRTLSLPTEWIFWLELR